MINDNKKKGGLSISALKKRDLPEVNKILKYWLIEFQHDHGRRTFEKDLHEYLDFIKNSFNTETRRFFVAKVDSNVVGIFGYTSEIDPVLKPFVTAIHPIQLRFFFVHPKYLRKRVGTALADKIVMEITKMSNTEGLFFSHERFYETGKPFHQQRKDFIKIKTIFHKKQNCDVYRVILTG